MRCTHLMQEGGTLSGAYLQMDRAQEADLYQRAEGDAARRRRAAEARRRSRVSRRRWRTCCSRVQVIYVLFAAVIAFGVVYNSARISLSERSRELATLRVIGFTRGEISYILLGELGLVTLAAVPARPRGSATGSWRLLVQMHRYGDVPPAVGRRTADRTPSRRRPS